MTFEQIWQAVLLGIVEGLTEFLPVSSTAHLVLFSDILNFQQIGNKVFLIVIQLGAILAVCWHYRKKLFTVTKSLTSDKNSQVFARNIILAFIPSVIIGVTFYKDIKELLFNPQLVCIALILGGCVLIYLDKIFANRQSKLTVDNLGAKKSFIIGCFQTLAMIPGTSRSGATIAGGLISGLNRVSAAEFSFFLAIPTMLSATIYDFYKNWAEISADQLWIILIGFTSAFISGIIVVKAALKFIANNGFRIFGIYRIIFGSLMLAFFSLA